MLRVWMFKQGRFKSDPITVGLRDGCTPFRELGRNWNGWLWEIFTAWIDGFNMDNWSHKI